MKFTLAQNQLAIMQEKSRLYSYLSAEFTKTYFSIGDGHLTIFFHGARGALKTQIPVPLSAEESTKYFQVDYGKWLNAVSKLSFADEIVFNLTAKYLKISTEGSTDSISLGIVSYEEDSSEAFNIRGFIESKKPVVNSSSLTMDKELADALLVTNSIFSSAAQNNAVALKKDSVMYADRSIILKVLVGARDEFLKDRDSVGIHKFVSGFLLQAMRFNTNFIFDEHYEIVYWEDENTKVVVASERCVIALPSDEELAMFIPQEDAAQGKFSIGQNSLYESLEFFNGFYEASVWKPITFLCKDNKAKLYYKHPTTEVSKNLDTAEFSQNMNAEFPIVSELLSKLLQKAIDSSDSEDVDSQKVTITYDEEAAGVHCVIGNSYDVVFAKLVQ